MTMASVPQMQTHRHAFHQVMTRVNAALTRHNNERHSRLLSVTYAERDRPPRSPSPVAPGKPVNKTVSSKSGGKTVSSKTRVQASASDVAPEADDRQEPHPAEQDDPVPRTEAKTTRVNANPIAQFAANNDGALMFGDMWIVATTFATSGLLPNSDIAPLTATALSIWCITSFVRGDYSTASEPDSSWIHGWSTYTGILYACHTWFFATPVLLLVYAILVSNGLMDADPVVNVAEGSRVSPALELQVALLILMTAWRGLYHAFKDGIL